MKKTKEDKIIPQKAAVCQVCWTKDPQEKIKSSRGRDVDLERKKVLELHHCVTCKVLVHKYCYDPSLHETKNWKCDFCKQQKSKNSKQQCFICKCEGKMLKYVDDNKFVHVHCGLGSDMVILENFKTLKFKLNPDYKPKQSKETHSKNKDKQNKSLNKCIHCKKDSTQALFKCYHNDCDFFVHIPCHLQRKLCFGSDDDITYNLLNQTIGSFRVKNHDFLRKNIQSLKAMEILQKPKKIVEYMTCFPHSSEIKWCANCFKTPADIGMSECCRCYRWIHTQCSTMKNKSQNSYFECDGCIKNLIYMQRALFPQQINRLVKIQTSPNKWTSDQIKYLDTFAFKSSLEIFSQILTKNKEEFQCYHLYSFLEKDYLKSFENQKDSKDKKHEPVQKIIEKLGSHMKEFNNKKIIEILYFLKYKQLRSKNELNTVNDINDLRDVYPKNEAKNNVKTNSIKAAQKQKCKKILNHLLDLYIGNLKQAELKDVSLKLVQFSDNIRKEIANIKDNNFPAPDMKKFKKNDNVQTLLELLKKRPYQIALNMREMLKMISQNKDKLKGKFDLEPQSQDQNNQSEGNTKLTKSIKGKIQQCNNFLMTLIKCVIAKDEGYDSQIIELQDLQDLIDSYRKIVYISRVSTKKPQKKLTLSDEEFYKMMNKSYDVNKTRLSEQSKIRISKFFKCLVKDCNIKETSQLKYQMTERYDQLIQEDRLNYKQTMAMRENIAQQGVYIDKHSKMLNLQKRATYYRVLKIKYMKIVRLQLDAESLSQSFPLKANEKNRKDIIENVKRLLDADSKSIKLTEAQKSSLQYFLVKEEVFTNILREQIILGLKLDAYNPERLSENNKIEAEGQQSSKKAETEQGQNGIGGQSKNTSMKGQLTVLQRIKRVFAFWTHNALQNPYQVIKILYPIAQKRIKFSLEYQSAFNDLIDSIGTRMDLLFKCEDQYINGSYSTPHKVNSDEFTKLWKLIEYAQLQNAFEKLKNLSEEYKQWLQDFQHRYNPIGKVLEDKFLNAELLEVIDRKIAEAERFQIDMKSEVKKLKTVKLWVVLSEKFQKDFERKATINAIQQFKSLMVKIHYPHNSIFQQVIELETYGRHLNERIEKYLKRQKYEDLEYYEEICLLNSKMSIKEAQELKNELENSKLDVSAELQTLEEQISAYNQIPSKIEYLFKKDDNLEELIKIKAKILQTPIRYESMETYLQLYHRISYLKCLTLEGNINRKQFFRLLNTSELGAVVLTQKMPQLLKAYRDLEKAEKQSLSTKPKWENLLPLDGKKIKAQLSNDPTTLMQVQKTYQKVQSLRQKFKIFKSTKQPYQRYVILESELSRYPVFYKDVQQQIHKMKIQVDDLVDRSMMLKKNFNPKAAHEISRQYNKLPIKHQQMESIKKIYEAYTICVALSERQQDYVEFSHKCREYPELESIITLNQTRSQLFGQYSEQALEQKAEASQQQKVNLSFLNVLIFEGTFLLNRVISSSKQNTSTRQKTLHTLLKINKKIDDMTKSSSNTGKKKSKNAFFGDQQNGEEMGEDEYDSGEYDEDGSGDSNGQYDDDDEEDEMNDYEDDEDMEFDDEYDDEEDSIPQPPKKRAQPLVMEISDEENEPAPDPRKVAHLNPTPALPVTNQQVNQIVQEIEENQNASSSEK